MALDLRGDLAGEFHEVVDDKTDDMEAISDNFCVGEVVLDEAPVRAGEIDTDDPYLVPALETGQVRAQIGLTAARYDVEDPVVFEIGKGGGKAQTSMKGMFVDAKEGRTLKAEAFGGLACGKLAVDAGDGSSPDAFDASHGGGGDPIVVALVDALAIGLGAVPSGKKSR